MWGDLTAFGVSLLVIVLSLQDGCFAGFCTHHYQCAATCYRQSGYYTSCGFLGIRRCMDYRATSFGCARTCSSQICCAGFTGRYCETPVCYGSTSCPNGGKCLAPDDCRCAIGFQKPKCTDINECADNNGGCEHNCVNMHGLFHCACRVGYQLAIDTVSCMDINECDRDRGGCEQTCTNNPGSFQCGCNKGYRISQDNRTCTDVDECVTGTSGCSQNCNNTVGSYKCSCSEGYRLALDKHQCEDIDECAVDTNGCEDYCSNNIGSFTCTCKPGYKLHQDGKTCNEIDECLVNNGGCAQICINTPGSYNCECRTGYLIQGDGQSCTDIDECKTGLSNCEQTCVNTPGSYNCTCYTGYLLNPDGRTCTDIDDCVSVECKHGGTCVDGIASYTCLCVPAYTGNLCKTDVNECDFLNGGCEDTCTNNIGSYVCGCRGNGTLNMDGKSCSGGTIKEDVFRRQKISRKFLPRGCSEIVLTKCKDDQDISIFLSSTSAWYTLKSNRQTVYTYGIVFAELNSLAVPISIPGVEVNMADGSFQIKHGAIVYPVGAGEPVGQTRTQDCWQFDVTSQDVFDFLESSSFLKSYFYSFVDSLPDWVQLKPTNESIIEAQRLKTELKYGRDIDSMSWCKGAPVLDDHLYSVFLFDTSFSVSVYANSIALPKPLNEQRFCFIMDLCQTAGGSVFLMIPEESQLQFAKLDVFRKLYEQSKVQIIPRGIGVSTVRGINVLQKMPTSLMLWNGDHKFNYSVFERADLWIGGKISTRYHSMFDIRGPADMFFSVQRPERMLTALFIDEWNGSITLRADVMPLLRTKLFGDQHILEFPDQMDLQTNIYMSVGGENPREMCGDHSNPPGYFLSTIVRVNPFLKVPILGDWVIENAHTLYVYIRTDQAFEVKGDLIIDIKEDIFQINTRSKHFKQFLGTIPVNFQNILDNSSSVFIDELKYLIDGLENLTYDGLNPENDFNAIIYIVTNAWKIYSEIENTMGDFFGKVDFLVDVAKDNFTTLLELEKESLKNSTKLAVEKLRAEVLLEEKEHADFHLKYTTNMVMFGFKFFGIDIEYVSSSSGIGSCSRFSKVYKLLEGRSSARFLGTHSKGFDYGYFLKVDAGMGVGGVLSEDERDTKAVLQVNAYINILGIKVTSDIFINEKGLYVFVEGNVWNIFLAQIDVSAEQGEDWYKVVFKLDGRFVAKARKRRQVQADSSSFQASYLDALERVVTLISDEAETRITQAQEALDAAKEELSRAQAWLNDKKEEFRKAHGAFDSAVAVFEQANQNLERAKRPFENALERLKNAERDVDNLCKIRSCRKICIPGIKCKTCRKSLGRFGSMSYPCCDWTSCMISFPDPICLVKNELCMVVRTIAFGVLEAARIAFKAPLVAFDVAKDAVSLAKYTVDKARVVVDLAEGVFDLARLGLEGAKAILDGAKGSLEAVKIVVGAAAKVLEFVIEHGIKNVIDTRNCGFSVELSTSDLPVFDVSCEVNAFKLGWTTIRMRINFKNAFQTIWQAAKATIKSIMKQFGGILNKRSIQDISFKTTSHMHVLIRHLRETGTDGFNATNMDNFLNQTLDILSEMDGFDSETVSDYDNRVLLFKQKCKRIKNILIFYNSTFEILNDIINESVSNLLQFDNAINLITEFEVSNMAENMTLEDAGISEEYAMNDYNITKEELDQAFKDAKNSSMNESLMVDIANSANFTRGIIDSEMKSVESLNVLSQWILVMENVTKDYFDETECADFRDCVFHSVSILYDLYEAEKLPNIDQTQRLISDMEDNIIDLFQNTSENVRDIYNTSILLSENIKTLEAMNLFCSEAPSFLSDLNNVTAVHGGVARLRCHVTASPEPVYWWYKDTEMLKVDVGKTLVIVNVSKTDEGVYKCMAGNVVANVSSNDARLMVKVSEEEIKRIDEANSKSDLGIILGATFSVVVGVGIIMSIVLYVVYRRIKTGKMNRAKREAQEGLHGGIKRPSRMQFKNFIYDT